MGLFVACSDVASRFCLTSLCRNGLLLYTHFILFLVALYQSRHIFTRRLLCFTLALLPIPGRLRALNLHCITVNCCTTKIASAEPLVRWREMKHFYPPFFSMNIVVVWDTFRLLANTFWRRVGGCCDSASWLLILLRVHIQRGSHHMVTRSLFHRKFRGFA